MPRQRCRIDAVRPERGIKAGDAGLQFSRRMAGEAAHIPAQVCLVGIAFPSRHRRPAFRWIATGQRREHPAAAQLLAIAAERLAVAFQKTSLELPQANPEALRQFIRRQGQERRRHTQRRPRINATPDIAQQFPHTAHRAPASRRRGASNRQSAPALPGRLRPAAPPDRRPLPSRPAPARRIAREAPPGNRGTVSIRVPGSARASRTPRVPPQTETSGNGRSTPARRTAMPPSRITSRSGCSAAGRDICPARQAREQRAAHAIRQSGRRQVDPVHGDADAVQAAIQPNESSVGPVGTYSQPIQPGVAQRPEPPEQERKIDFTGARLMTTGIVGQLNMTDAREIGLQRAGQIALHHLGVVDVVLQREIGPVGFIQQGDCGAPCDRQGNPAYRDC
jgi:hypothetical protein